MRPVRLQLVGLRSWRTERELRFDDIDLAAIIGPTGAGKSSILEAIVYALYNASTYDQRGVGSLISSDGRTMSVTLDFDANGERWRATRSTSRGNYPPSVHKLTCLSNPAEHPPVESERAVNAAIEALIGLDLQQFLTAVLLPQGRFQRLLMATAGERAGILKGVFRLDELGEIRERAVSVRRDRVEPALEVKQAERAQLLPDPEATLVEASATADQSAGVVDTLAGFKEAHDKLTTKAGEAGAAATQARAQAEALRSTADAVPPLDDAIAAEEAISKEEADLGDLRTTQVGERDQAQARLDEAAAARMTLQTLATAFQILDTARKTLPTLAENEKGLSHAHTVLTAQRQTLDDDARAHAEQLDQLAGAAENVSALQRSAEQATARLTQATSALSALRSANEKLVSSRAAVEQHEQLLAAATAIAASAATEAAADKAKAEGAEGALDAARKAHEAARLAAGLRPGEPCRTCARELPDGFTAPDAPALTGAEREAKRLRKLADDSAAAAHRAAANAETLETQLTNLRATRTSADEAAATARQVAEAELGEIDLAQNDTHLLAGEREAAETAKAAYDETDRELAATKARLDSATETLRQRAQMLADRTQALALEAERIEREHAAQKSALASLPEALAPTDETLPAIVSAAEACTKRLDEIQDLHNIVGATQKEIERLDDLLHELRRKRTDNVDTPRRHATGAAREIAAKLRELRTDLDLPVQPAETAQIADHTGWVNDIVIHARQLAQELDAAADKNASAGAQAKQKAKEQLQGAQALLEKPIVTGHDLDHQLNEWRARLLAAQHERDKAVQQIPQAARLDEQILRLRDRRESLEEVARLLGDGQFIRWIVERRQQLLLVVASEIFAGMTGGRYRFAADFTVIDGRTGIARNPRTLSGGESFMASLALALAMAENAARSGGRIGSLYLDEGFGALDPNALDEAINALELRARSGQMILIVSHVPAVAQRIERVLEVRPDPVGSSAQWLDDEDRESLLVAAAAEEA